MILATHLENCSSVKKGKTSLESLSISTDTRDLEGANTFVALYGENFDGFNFIDKAIKAGTQLVVFKEKENREEAFKKAHPNQEYLVVKDTFSFLQELAKSHLSQWRKQGRKVIAITGSNGKTTNKEILKSLLEEVFPNEVLATKGNLNNHLGVPKTIFDLKENHRYAIIEMGTNHPGEIELLCQIAEPDAGYITNIGKAHLEFLKDLNGVLNEKGALARSIEKNQGCFILNLDDPYLRKLNSLKYAFCISSKENDESAQMIWRAEKDRLYFNFDGKPYQVENQNFYTHLHWQNLMYGLSLCFCLFPDKREDFLRAAGRINIHAKNRGEILSFNQAKIFLDAYNANPDSMRASLKVFMDYLSLHQIEKEKSLIILGDMNEIGEKTEQEHRELVQFCLEQGFSYFVFVGRYSSFYQKESPSSLVFSSVKELVAIREDVFAKYKACFIKGSRSVQLEKALE